MEETNQPKKDYFEPSYTVQHIITHTLTRMIVCECSHNAHIERKKSKIDYFITPQPTEEQLKEVERKVNEVIKQNLDITEEFVTKDNVPSEVDLSKLPADASDTLRIVRVGDYDICACIGAHVDNTSEIGEFKMLNADYENGRLRMRFKIVQ